MKITAPEPTIAAACAVLSPFAKDLTPAELNSFLRARNAPAAPTDSKAAMESVPPKEAAKILHVTPETLRAWAKAGRIEYRKITVGGIRKSQNGKEYRVGGTVRIPMESIRAVLLGKA